MTAAAAPKKISQYDGPDWLPAVGVKAGVTIYHGTMVGLNTTGDQLAPATVAIAPKGVADLSGYESGPQQGAASVFGETTGQKVTNAGADGAIKINVRQGVFEMENKAGDLVTTALQGKDVYVEDDQTVRATGAGSVVAGVLVGFHDVTLKPLVSIGVKASYGRM